MNMQTLIYLMFLIVQTVNGNWGLWSPWKCSVTCGTGTQLRTRSCLRSNACFSGSRFEKENCIRMACPVDGNWGPWSLYGPCSVPCGKGMQERTRVCNDPAPVGSGKPCDGVGTSSKSCNVEACAAAFTATLPGGNNPYPKDGEIIYNKMLCKDPGYKSTTGIFTVGTGMAGSYLVSVTMMSGTLTAHTTLRKNGDIYVWLYTSNQYDMATQTVCMQLEVGDKIWAQMTNQASSLFDVYNTFSAVRIP